MPTNTLIMPARFGGGGGVGTALEQVSQQALDHLTEQTPWDDTVSVPSGSNRLALVFQAIEGTETHSSTVMPVGGPAFTTADSINGVTKLYDSYLLEANMPAAGNRVLRSTWSLAQLGARQVIMLRNAAQTAPARGENNAASSAALTVSVTRGSGNFPTGSRVYAALWDGDGTQTYTVTGNATEVRDVEIAVGWGRFVFATGVLASPAATASVTFTASATVNRLAGTIFVVEEAGLVGSLPAVTATGTLQDTFAVNHDIVVTVSGTDSNRYLLGVIGFDASITIVSATWFPNGTGSPGTSQAMTAVIQKTHSTQTTVKSQVWGLANPTAGVSGTLRIVSSAGMQQVAAAIAIKDANQGTPISTSAEIASGTSISAGLTVTDANTLVIDVATNLTETSGYTATASQTPVIIAASDNAAVGVGYKTAGTIGSITMSYSMAFSGQNVIAVVGVEPV